MNTYRMNNKYAEILPKGKTNVILIVHSYSFSKFYMKDKLVVNMIIYFSLFCFSCSYLVTLSCIQCSDPQWIKLFRMV